MSKKKNRKKALKLQMKRQGLLEGQPTQVSEKPAKTTKKATSKKAVAKKPASKVATSKAAAGTLEDFASLKEVADLRANVVESFYEAGIRSAADFANFTEKDLLALKGVGPAAVKKLQENGVSLKA